MGAILLSPIYIIVNVYVAWWLLQYMGACYYLFQSSVVRGIIVICYLFLSTTLLSSFLIKKEPWHRILKVISNYWLGSFAYILMTIISFDVVRIVGKKSRWLPETWFGTRKAFLIVGGVAIVVILVLSVYGIVHAKNLVVDRRELIIEKSCGQKELTIALVADWHLGYSIGAKRMQQMVDKINEENVDFVCVAGDQFDNEFDAILEPKKIAKILRGIKSRYGVYGVSGNHDLNEKILAGFTFPVKEHEVHDERFDTFLEEANIKMLDGHQICIDDSFYLIGREDPQRAEKLGHKRKTPEQLLKGIDKTKPIFVIDHQPKELEQLAALGVDLDLSGHTHDGQMFPGNLFTAFGWKNSNGVKRIGTMYSCVTSGVGLWGPDMRVGTDSEIMILHIVFSHS